MNKLVDWIFDNVPEWLMYTIIGLLFIPGLIFSIWLATWLAYFATKILPFPK